LPFRVAHRLRGNQRQVILHQADPIFILPVTIEATTPRGLERRMAWIHARQPSFDLMGTCRTHDWTQKAYTSAALSKNSPQYLDKTQARGRAFWPGGFSCSKLFTVVHVLSSVTKMAHCTNQDVVTLSILLLRVRRFTQSEPPLESSIEPQIVSMEGFNERTTASVPIQDCLNRGVHPIELCPVLCPPPNATDCDQVHGHRLKALLGNASGALHHNS